MMSKSLKKRFRQGTLSDFIQITKMIKTSTESSASSSSQAASNQVSTSEDQDPPIVHKSDNLSTEKQPDVIILSDSISDEKQITEGIHTVRELETKKTCGTENLELNTKVTKNNLDAEKTCTGSALQTSNSIEVLVSETDSLDSEYSSENFSSDNLKRYTQFPPSLPSLAPSEEHTVLFNYNTLPTKAPLPHPKSYRDKWDSVYVRLPCSSQSLYPVSNALTGESELQPRWDIIQCALSNPILCSVDLEEAILTYNSQYSRHWKFKILHKLFNEHLKPNETREFFDTVMPKLIDLCLQTPHVCTQPIPLLKIGSSHKITISQKQIACLLANAFFCTFPRRNTTNRNSEYGSYPGINFYTLYDPNGRPNKVEKLKCLVNYFKRVTKEEPTGVVTFHRQCVKDFPSWKESKKPLANLCVQSDGLIEVDGMGMLQIDFANKYVGGGVLGSGCVQEEIRFILCPELIISRLFTERLDKNEALIITGCEQFNQHTGYAETFMWDGNFEDCIPRDSWGRKLTRVVAIDALHFACATEQFKPTLTQREMEKAYAGYLEQSATDFLPAVATGNWGCGAFRGDPRLKALIQLISASEVGRDLFYLTFNDKQLENDLRKMHSILRNRNITVGQLVSMLEAYYQYEISTQEKESLYSFLFQKCMDSDSETELESQL